MAVSSREVIAKLQADGWRRVGQRGSHVQFKHLVKSGRVTGPSPRRDLPLGLIKSIERQARFKLI